MATFARATFPTASYAAFRPSYPASIYQKVLNYHKGPQTLCLDLDTGHGVVPRYLSKSFEKIIGTDPSAKMVAQAKKLSSSQSNLTFQPASAEDMPFIKPNTVDLVTAAQAAHWFSQIPTFAELARIVRPGGTLAFWGYKDHVLVDHPAASRILNLYAYGPGEHYLGDYWPQPGRSIIQRLLRAIDPPTKDWADVQRVEYEPGTSGAGTGNGEVLMQKQMLMGEMEEYVRTWSSVHAWQLAHPERIRRRDGGKGDVVDDMMDAMVASERTFRRKGALWRKIPVTVEWGSVILMARKK